MFISTYFVGYGIDIGGGSDSLKNQITRFPRIKSVRNWDINDGDAQDLQGVDDETFDFVYSSHCLEHLRDPAVALKNWLRVLKPGGYLVVTVPDEDMYEQGVWPSPYNADHKWSFTVWKDFSALPKSINVIDLINDFAIQIDPERLIRVKNGYLDDAGNIDQTLGAAECAIEFVWQKRKPDPKRLLQMADLYESRGQFQSAIELYAKVIEQHPLEFDTYNRLSNVLIREGWIIEAEYIWNVCVSHLPDLHIAHMYRALFLISIGKYDQGFALRDPLVLDERRTLIKAPDHCRKWGGENLQGKSIVIWTEFGFGDEIMFARFVSIFKRLHKASRVSIVCQKPLLSLFRTMPLVDLVVADSDTAQLPDHDYWVFPHSIPVHHSLEKYGVLGDRVCFDIPKKIIRAISHKLPNKKPGRLRVGFVSTGSASHENNQLRSIQNLKNFESIFRIPGIDWIDLQQESSAGKFSDLNLPSGFSLTHMGERLTDFMQTGAVCSQLDLVISVDTSVAHLAGTLNVPVWLMLPTYADWRWGVNQVMADWYPSMQIFRQHRTGNWSNVVRQIHDALCEKLMNVDI